MILCTVIQVRCNSCSHSTASLKRLHSLIIGASIRSFPRVSSLPELQIVADRSVGAAFADSGPRNLD